MTDENLFSLVLKSHQTSSTDSSEYFVSQLISAGMSYDETYFDSIFNRCLDLYGMTETYKKIIYPIMDRIGLMWASDSMPTAHEHYISNIIRKKLSVAIDSSAPVSDPSAESWLLFLPENEFHEIGLMYAHYMIRQSGRKVIYLGSNVPMESVYSAINDTKPQYLLMFLVHYDFPEQIQKRLEELNASFSGKGIYLAGNQKLLSRISFPDKTRGLFSIDSFDHTLQSNSIFQN